MSDFRSPFVYFGGKSKIASTAWRYFGADVKNYVEPFFGSGAVLLHRPGWSPDVSWNEVVNDKDGFVANFFRALRYAPQQVAEHAHWYRNENDLHARHAWLSAQASALSRLLEGDPDYYDAKIAGWWLWGISLWIGGRWASGENTGPWHVVTGEDGLRRLLKVSVGENGVHRSRMHISSGVGIHRETVYRKKGDQPGTGTQGLYAWMRALSERFQRVCVLSGDWSRAVTNFVVNGQGRTAVFLDPPYSAGAGRNMNLYSQDDGHVANVVREWCMANGNNPQIRIILCGYDGEHNELEQQGWRVFAWQTQGGYSYRGNKSGRENSHRERLWISPHCLRWDEGNTTQMNLFIEE